MVITIGGNEGWEPLQLRLLLLVLGSVSTLSTSTAGSINRVEIGAAVPASAGTLTGAVNPSLQIAASVGLFTIGERVPQLADSALISHDVSRKHLDLEAWRRSPPSNQQPPSRIAFHND